MPRTKEQNMAIRAEKRQLIMDTALKLFAEHGFESTSIERIARHAGISTGLLYAYFKNKEDLLQQILVSGLNKFAETYPPEITMQDFLVRIEQMFDHILENREFFKLYSILGMQPKVTPILSNLPGVDTFRETLSQQYQKYFGKSATNELLLMAVIMKGFPIIALFGDMQDFFPVDLLKNVVMDFFRERYSLTIRV